MSVELTEFGAPIEPTLPTFRIKGRVAEPSRVKDHPVWQYEEKPWADYLWVSTKMHTSIECHYFYRTAKQLGGNCVSLGAYKGLSSACMAHGLKASSNPGKVYSVDLFNHFMPGTTVQIDSFNQGIAAAGLTDLVQVCEGYTHVWAHKLRKLKFKFILIDADHHYETCKQDFEMWSPLLDNGGLIGFHDVDMATVDKVIQEIDLTKWQRVEHIYKLKVYARR